MSDTSNMYEVYTWYAWGFGYWVFKGFYHTKKEALESIKNKRLSTYIIAKNREIVIYHKCDKTRERMAQPVWRVTYENSCLLARNRQFFQFPEKTNSSGKFQKL